MRKVEIALYTIEELKKLDTGAYNEAIESIRYVRETDFYDFEVREILDTIKKVAEFFHMELTHYDIQLWGPSYVYINVSNYYALSEGKKQELSKWLQESLQEGMDGSCPFTGVVYDCYFFDKVDKLINGLGVDITNLDRLVPEALEEAVNQIVNDYERDTLNNESNEQYAIDNGLEFYENGVLFKKIGVDIKSPLY